MAMLTLMIGRTIQLRASLFFGARILVLDKDFAIQWTKKRLVDDGGDDEDSL